MGQRRFGMKLYYQLSLEQLVSEDHLLRRLAAAVDFSFVRSLCRPFYSPTGQPSVDPVVLFKMLLVGYLYGITSERRLAREIQLNLAYRWFLGYDLDEAVPDHSVPSKARARFSAAVSEEFFRRSIDLCRAAGLVTEGPVYVERTRIRAGASVDSLSRREEPLQPPLSVTEYLHRLDQEAAEEDETPPSETGPTSGATAAKSARKLPPNQAYQSRTDPEATLVNRPDFGRHCAYKAHIAVAGRRGQVITAAVATTGTVADEHLLAEVLWTHRRPSRLGVPAVVADAKYGTTDNFLYLGQLGIPTFVPTTRFGTLSKDIWGREHFVWLAQEDAYRCPAGQKLRRYANVRGTDRVHTARPRGAVPCVLSAGNVRPPAERERSTALGAGVCRVGRGTAGQPFGEAAHDRTHDIRRGRHWSGKRVARPAAHKIQGKMAGPDSGLADGGGDEHQTGGADHRSHRLAHRTSPASRSVLCLSYAQLEGAGCTRFLRDLSNNPS